MVSLIIAALVLALAAPSCCNDFRLIILHTGDIHAQFEPHIYNRYSVGGIGRSMTFIEKRRANAKAKGIPTIYLDSGDIFTGSIWFQMYSDEICAKFVNKMNVDAMCLGNHEFDKGIATLERFLQNTNVKLLCCNCDLGSEKGLKGKIIPSTILDVSGRKIGVVGYLDKYSMTTEKFFGTVRLLDETAPIRKEVEKMKSKGINIIIVLSHGGYSNDKELVEKLEDVDIIVGGHSHSFLYSGSNKKVTLGKKPSGEYPTIVNDKSGKPVYIVHALARARYVGELDVTFDDNGVIKSIDGSPHLMGKEIPEHQDAVHILNEYREAVDKLKSTPIGKTYGEIDGYDRICRRTECQMGNLITDAFAVQMSLYTGTPASWNKAGIYLINGGAVSGGITPKENSIITYGDLVNSLPFGNVFVMLRVKGKDIREALEFSISSRRRNKNEFLQVSGIKAVLDLGAPKGDKVISVSVRCGEGHRIIKYFPLKDDEDYLVGTIDYVIEHRSGFKMFFNKTIRGGEYERKDIYLMVREYLSFLNQTVEPVIEQRIVVLNNKDREEESRAVRDMLCFSDMSLLMVFLLLYR